MRAGQWFLGFSRGATIPCLMLLTTKLIAPEGSRSTSVGSALDPHFYLGPNVLDRELEAIFARSWQHAGHVTDLPETGTYLTATAGDQPVLLPRGDDGEIRAYRNVCRHRGSQLLTGSGRCKKAIRCRYIDLHPDQVTVWQMVPAGIDQTRDIWGCFGPRRRGPLTRIAQRLNHHVNGTVLDEDIDLVAAVRRGIRTRGYRPRPLADKERAVGWFADRIRADLGEAVA